ncbi:MAG: BON domain-containing protein [Burkholderiales bacterium]
MLIAVLLVALVPLLQGCFPLAITGMGTAAVMADDRRTTGMYIEDENIEWKALGRLNEKFKTAHVNATSYNRRVLLTGEAPAEDLKKQIGEEIRSIASVVEVTNELQVAGASSLTARGNDSLITTSVKARMINNGKFSPNHVKVVTEASTVYLMGLVTQSEGEAAVELARTTSGVRAVVKVFEYIK